MAIKVEHELHNRRWGRNLGLGLILVGLVFMFIMRARQPEFFRGETIKHATCTATTRRRAAVLLTLACDLRRTCRGSA